MLSSRLTRRLVLSGALAAGGAAMISACAATATPAPAKTEATAAPAAAEATAVPAEVEATAVATEAAAVPEAPAEAVTLRFRSWVSGATSPMDQAWYDWLTEHYAQDFNGSKIDFEFVNFGAEYIQKLLADAAAGSPPDLLDSSIIWARDFYDRGVLLELNEFLANEPEMQPDRYVGDSTNAYRSKAGAYYGVPYWGPDSEVIVTNAKLFTEAGLDPDAKDIVTWDDFVSAAKALTKAEGDEVTQAGYLVGSFRYIEAFATWIYSNGGAMHDDDITRPTFNNDRGSQVIQLHLDLLNKDKVSMPISPERQDTELYLQSKVAMTLWGTWAPTYIGGNAPEDFDYRIILVPKGPQGDGTMLATTWSNMLIIPQKTKDPKSAFALAKYVSTPPNIITRFELSNRTAPHKALFESEAWGKQLEKYPALDMVPKAAEVGGVYPFFPCFTEANDVIGTELEQVMLGQKTVEEGLSEAEQKVTEVLARRSATSG